MRKAIYVIAALLAFASADGTPRKSGSRVQVVLREESDGHWQAFLFGPACAGKLEVIQQHDQTQPIQIVCK